MENKGFKIGLFMLPLLTQGGGAEKYFIELARNLREREIEADVITMDEKFFRKFARLLHIFISGNFFGKIDISGREKEESIKKQLGKARWIKTSFRDLEKVLGAYDIIYTKNELVDLFLLKLKGYQNLPPLVVGIHTPLFYPHAQSFLSKLHNFLYLSPLYKKLLEKTKLIHTSNRFTQNLLQEKLNFESELVYYPFSAKTMENLAKENIFETHFGKEKKNIIFSGRLGEQKGVRRLINLIHKISADPSLSDKVYINIFGSGEKKYEEEIENLAANFLFVRYFGHVENKFMPHILAQQDLLIAPSQWETLPYNILEAQALGVPAIAFAIPGPLDIIEDGKTGFLVKSEEEFFEKIKLFIEGKIHLDKKMIVQNVEEKFDPDKIYSRLIRLFQKVLCQS